MLSSKHPTVDNRLHHAVSSGDLFVVEFLLNKGYEVHERVECTAETALHWAAKNQDIPITEKLLSYGADVNAASIEEYSTALLLAIDAECPNTSYIRLLLNNGAHVDISSRHGKSPLHIAISKGLWDIASLLVECSANVNARTLVDNETPLMLAIQRHDLPVSFARDLLYSKANVNAVCRKVRFEEWRAIHFAAMAKNVDICKLLVEYGADVNCTSSDGDTPLHIAVRLLQKEIVELLVQNGAKCNAKPRRKRNPQPLCWAGYMRDTLLEVELDVCKYIIRQLAVEAATGKDILDENIRFMKRHSILMDRFSVCHQNVLDMKTEYICENVSLYTVLTTNNPNQLAKFTKLGRWQQYRAKAEYVTQYSEYKNMLEKRFADIEERRILLDNSEDALEAVMGYVLPKELLKNILVHCKKQDLKRLQYFVDI